MIPNGNLSSTAETKPEQEIPSMQQETTSHARESCAGDRHSPIVPTDAESPAGNPTEGSAPPARSDSCPNLDAGSTEYLRRLAALQHDLPIPDIKLIGVSYTVRVIKNEKRRFEIPGLVSELLGQLVCRRCREPKEDKRILTDVNLRFAPGTSTLILGPPSSGTSLLLKAISGQFAGSKNFSGAVLCNDIPISDFNWKKMTSFCGQYDVQFSDTTATNVLQFTSRSLNGSGSLEKLGQRSLERCVAEKPETLISLLGLTNCKDTIIGDEFNRGCSGGEKKRISVGEALCGPSRVLLLDKFSTGLDSAMTLSISRYLTEWARLLKGVVVAHMLQPDPQVIGLFDQLVVLEHGRVIYCGPPSEGVPFFGSANLHCPADKDLGSFFSDVAVQENRAIYSSDRSALTTDQMVEFYRKSDYCRRVESDLAGGKQSPAVDPSFKDSAVNHEMLWKNSPVSTWQQFMLLLIYHFKNTGKNMTLVFANIMQQVFTGLFLGWLFFQGDKSDFIQKYGVLAMVFSVLINASMPILMQVLYQRSMVYKQMDRGCYSAALYLTSYTIHLYAIQLVQTIIFGAIVYFMHGFTLSHPKHFFLHLLILFLSYIVFTSLYGILFYLFKGAGTIMTSISFLNIFINCFNGFMIAKNIIPKWLIEFYYANPVTYSLRALVVNEFTSTDYNRLDQNNLTGIDYLNSYDMPHSIDDLYLDTWMLVGFHILFVCIQILLLAFQQHDPFPFSSAIDNSVDIKPMTQEELSLSVSQASEMSDSNFQRATFSFRDISYTVKVKSPETKKQADKILLDRVSGYVKAGSMTALMGASGAGKTTLLDVITGRKTAGRVEGLCLINGAPYTAGDFAKITGYVEQGDTLPSTETVREALRFSAVLRYPGRPARCVIDKYVGEVIEMLGLTSYADQMIGELGSGLPMGTRKLVMLGIELAANPSIIFLDEPTTGLDSTSALAVVQTLQRIASTGRSIICTIHQPSFEIFTLFSDILLLERGGRVVYFGKTGAAGETITRYIESIEGIAPKDPKENPASYILDVTGAGLDATQSSVTFGPYYTKSDYFRDCLKNLAEIEGAPNPYHTPEIYAASFGRQVLEVTNRYFRLAYRNMDFNAPRIRFVFVISLVFGLLCLKLDLNTNSAVQSALGLCFAMAMNIGMSGAMSFIPVLFSIRATFYRESAMKTYHPIALWIALFVVHTCYLVLVTVLCSAIVYPMVGLRPGFRLWFYFAVALFFWVMMVEFFAIANSFSVPSVALAQMMTGMIIGCILIPCSGYVMPYKSMRPPWSWIYWVNPMMYYIQSVAVDQFVCDDSYCPTFLFGKDTITVKQYLVFMFSIRYDQRTMIFLGQFITLAVGWVLSLLAVWKVRYQNR